MKFDRHGNAILDEEDLIAGLYSGKINDLSSINVKDENLINQFNFARNQNSDTFESLKQYIESDLSIEEFDKINQENWYMPDYYKSLDIELFILQQCKRDDEFERVTEELILFRQYGMTNVLKYLKYLVDTMRANNIVWGVGRGSSLSSYCLYLIGIHKVDSIKYQLDINEFLK